MAEYWANEPEDEEVLATNLIPNPLGVPYTPQTGWNGYNATLSPGPNGGVMATATTTGQAGLFYGVTTSALNYVAPVVSGGQYSASVKVTNMTAGRQITPMVIFRNSAGTNMAGILQMAPLSAPGTSSISFAAPAGAVQACVAVYRTSGSVGDFLVVESITLVSGTVPPRSFGGSSLVGGSPLRTRWVGKENKSTSQLLSVVSKRKLRLDGVDNDPVKGSLLEADAPYGSPLSVPDRGGEDVLLSSEFSEWVTVREPRLGPKNLISNPRPFRATGWTSNSGALTFDTVSNSPTGEALILTTGGASDPFITETGRSNISYVPAYYGARPGDTFTLSAWVRVDEAGKGFYSPGGYTPLTIWIGTAAGTYTYMRMTQSELDKLVVNEYVRVSLTVTLPANAYYFFLRLYGPKSIPSVVRFAGIQLLRNHDYPDYIAGDVPGCVWDGPPNASTSTKLI